MKIQKSFGLVLLGLAMILEAAFGVPAPKNALHPAAHAPKHDVAFQPHEHNDSSEHHTHVHKHDDTLESNEHVHDDTSEPHAHVHKHDATLVPHAHVQETKVSMPIEKIPATILDPVSNADAEKEEKAPLGPAAGERRKRQHYDHSHCYHDHCHDYYSDGHSHVRYNGGGWGRGWGGNRWGNWWGRR